MDKVANGLNGDKPSGIWIVEREIAGTTEREKLSTKEAPARSETSIDKTYGELLRLLASVASKSMSSRIRKRFSTISPSTETERRSNDRDSSIS